MNPDFAGNMDLGDGLYMSLRRFPIGLYLHAQALGTGTNASGPRNGPDMSPWGGGSAVLGGIGGFA